jgi:sigma-E factor negative regulatory protein RseC
MAIEKGVVIRLGAKGKKTAWIKTIQAEACKACASRKSCASGANNAQPVEAINQVGAQVGDIIQVYMNTSSLLKAAFLLYVFPILCMMAGGAAGYLLTGRLGLDSPLLPVGTAFGCFALAMILVRIRAGRMAFNIEYRPKITRILGHQKDTSTENTPIGDCSA